MADDSPGVSADAGGDAAGREPTHLPFGKAGGLQFDNKFESVMCSCARGVKTDHRCRVEMADGLYTNTDRGDEKRICSRTICANCIIDESRDKCFLHDDDDNNSDANGSGGGSDTGTTTNSPRRNPNAATGTQASSTSTSKTILLLKTNGPSSSALSPNSSNVSKTKHLFLRTRGCFLTFE